MSADEPTVKVWKVRVIVYGVLLAIGGLVLAARPGSSSDPKPAPLRTLRGTTGQGSRVAIGMDGRHIRVLSVSHVSACGHRFSWQAAVGMTNVDLSDGGEPIGLEQSWRDGERIFMIARIDNGAHKIGGSIQYEYPRCPAERIPFSASG
jgi:hypothetical protein